MIRRHRQQVTPLERNDATPLTTSVICVACFCRDDGSVPHHGHRQAMCEAQLQRRYQFAGIFLRSPRRNKYGHDDGSNHQKQVGVAGLLAGGGDHGVRLAAMMCLMIEEMRNQETAGLAHLSVD